MGSGISYFLLSNPGRIQSDYQTTFPIRVNIIAAKSKWIGFRLGFHTSRTHNDFIYISEHMQILTPVGLPISLVHTGNPCAKSLYNIQGVQPLLLAPR